MAGKTLVNGSVFGCLGRDARVINTKNGSLISLALAIDRGTKDSPKTEWVEVLMDENPDFKMENFKKGSLVGAFGELFPEFYQSGTGNAHAVSKMRADHVFLPLEEDAARLYAVGTVKDISQAGGYLVVDLVVDKINDQGVVQEVFHSFLKKDIFKGVVSNIEIDRRMVISGNYTHRNKDGKHQHLLQAIEARFLDKKN